MFIVCESGSTPLIIFKNFFFLTRIALMRFVISCRHDHADVSTWRNAYLPGDFWNWMLTVESVRYVLRAVICQKRYFSPSRWSRITVSKLFENRWFLLTPCLRFCGVSIISDLLKTNKRQKKAELVNYNYYAKFNCKTIHPKKVLKNSTESNRRMQI